MSNQQQTKQHCFHTLQHDDLNQLVEKVVSQLSSVEFDRLACIDLLPLALTSLVSIALDKPFVIIRKQVKGYGTNNAVEGKINSGDKLALLTFDFDSATQDIIKRLEAESYQIQGAITFQEESFPTDLSFNVNYID